MINFNPELGQKTVDAVRSQEIFLVNAYCHQLALESQVEVCCQADCPENCDCCNINYTDSEAVADKLQSLLDDAKTAPFDRAYSQIFPQFLCIAQRSCSGVTLLAQEAENGDTGSEPSLEQSPEEDASW